MKYPELIKTLEEYGLKERHAKIYLSLLSIGTGSIQMVSKKCGYARSTCESVLRQLQQKGFVSSFKKKKVCHYNAEDPHQLVDTAEQKAELLRLALPKFIDLYKSHESTPTMRYYEGKAGMRIVLREILDEAKSLICLGSADDLFQTILKYTENFIAERIKRKIHLRVILKDTPFARQRKSVERENLMQVKITSSKHPITSLMYIWNHKVAMFSLQKDIAALVIDSDELTNMQRSMFETMWENID